MNLKTAKTVLMILGVLLAASLLGGILTKKELFYWLDALIALCTIVFHVVFWRCPKCRKWMGGGRTSVPSAAPSSSERSKTFPACKHTPLPLSAGACAMFYM